MLSINFVIPGCDLFVVIVSFVIVDNCVCVRVPLTFVMYCRFPGVGPRGPSVEPHKNAKPNDTSDKPMTNNNYTNTTTNGDTWLQDAAGIPRQRCCHDYVLPV